MPSKSRFGTSSQPAERASPCRRAASFAARAREPAAEERHAELVGEPREHPPLGAHAGRRLEDRVGVDHVRRRRAAREALQRVRDLGPLEPRRRGQHVVREVARSRCGRDRSSTSSSSFASARSSRPDGFGQASSGLLASTKSTVTRPLWMSSASMPAGCWPDTVGKTSPRSWWTIICGSLTTSLAMSKSPRPISVPPLRSRLPDTALMHSSSQKHVRAAAALVHARRHVERGARRLRRARAPGRAASPRGRPSPRPAARASRRRRRARARRSPPSKRVDARAVDRPDRDPLAQEGGEEEQIGVGPDEDVLADARALDAARVQEHDAPAVPATKRAPA